MRSSSASLCGLLGGLLVAGCSGGGPVPLDQLTDPRFELESVSISTGRVSGRLRSDDACFAGRLRLEAFGVGDDEAFAQTDCDDEPLESSSARFSVELGRGAAERILTGQPADLILTDDETEIALDLPPLFLPFEATLYEVEGSGTEDAPATFEVREDLFLGAEAITEAGLDVDYFAIVANANGSFPVAVSRAPNANFLRLALYDDAALGNGLLLLHHEVAAETFDCGGGMTCTARTGQISTVVHVVVEEDPDFDL